MITLADPGWLRARTAAANWEADIALVLTRADGGLDLSSS